MREFCRRYLFSLILVSSSVYLSGCASDPVAEDLSQSQATTIVATLSENGVPAQASRDTGSKGRYSVSVKHQWYNQAVMLLHERGLPKQEEMSFAETVASRGFLPNSREIESLRIDRAQAAEIEEALKVNPAIQEVRVIVRRASVPEGSNAGVSIVTQLKPGAAVNVEDVRSVVLKVIPGISADNVFVATAPGVPPSGVKEVAGVRREDGRTVQVPLSVFLGFWHVADGDISGLSLTLLIGLLLIGGIGGFLGYWYGYLQQTRMVLDSSLPEIPKGLRQLDRPRRFDLEEET